MRCIDVRIKITPITQLVSFFILNSEEKYHNQNLVESHKIHLDVDKLKRLMPVDETMFHRLMNVFTHKLIQSILACKLNHVYYTFIIMYGKGIHR